MSFSEKERRDALRRFIEYLESARLAPGMRLPGEAVLANRLGVTRHLVRYVLSLATEEGLIARRGRSGTYLVRRPETGSVQLLDRGWAPVGSRNRTISLMLGFPVAQSDLGYLQRFALEHGYLLQIYFSGEHRHRPEEERAYLEQAVSNEYAGAVIHATPIQPVNEEFFRRASAQLRIAHIGYHSTELPAQSFFLPDLVYAGAICAAELLARGCRRITLAMAIDLDEHHHVPRLIWRGMEPICASHGVELSAIRHAYRRRELDKLLAGGPARGVVFNSPDQSFVGVLPDDWRERAPQCLMISEYLEDPFKAGLSGWLFDWRLAVTEALAWVMADHEGLTHRLYLPRFQPAS